MRLGTSSQLKHNSPEEWAENQVKLGCSTVVFPLRYYVEKMNVLDPDMPVILEHLNTDEEYIKYMNYLKEQLNGLYKTL